MPAPCKQTHIADSARLLARTLLEAVLLYIAPRLHEEGNGKCDTTNDICRFAKSRLGPLGHAWRVQHRDWHADDPDPNHLKYPEAQEREELVPLVIESVVLPGLENAEEQETGEACAPDHDEETAYYLSRIESLLRSERERHDGKDDEIGAAGEVGQLVEFETEGDRKEEQLVGDRD